MRRVREILRLKFECGSSDRAIAVAVSVARSTVQLCLARFAATGLSWPLPATLTEQGLEALLFAPLGGSSPGQRRKTEPDWAAIHRELRRPGMTLLLLWEEYRAVHSGGYGYSRWCELYRSWEARLSPTMRQVHAAGERLFVDYAGQTVEVADGSTGELRTAQVFVAVLGASNYTYAEASWTQSLPDWIGSHVRTLEFLGGVPRQIVPDNLRAGVLRANWYEPGINPTYRDLAAHYGTAIVPTRVRKPRDKAKVEVAVQVVERWVLARLRHRRFFSLGELNAAIRDLIDELNTRTMRRIGSSRHALFEAIERAALLALPSEPFEYAEWKRCRPGLDYHIEVQGHWYSVPYRLIREVVEARATDRTVEVFHHGVRVAVHVRSPLPHRHTTLPDHMPSAHRRYADWTPARLRREATQIGPAAAALIELILKAKPHPEQGFRACLGILRLVRAYGAERVEAACQRGIDIGARTYGSIVSILRNNLDRAYRPQPVPDAPSVQHGNIRGGRYYH